MNIDDLGRDAARALIDAGKGAPIPPLDPKRSDRRRNVLAFAMSAAVVIVVVGVAALFGGMLVDDPELDPANTTVVDTTVVATTTPPVQSTTSSTVAPDVVVSPEFAANGWALELVENGGSGDSSMVDVVTSPNLNRSVAVGFVSGGQPAAWTWTDGSWQQIVVEGSEAGGSLVDVSVDAAGFVAVGTLDGQPTVWRSNDGLGLTIDTNLPPPSSGVAFPAAVTGHGDGVVVVGVGFEGPSEGHAPQDNMDGVVWVANGDGWQVIQSPAFATPGFGADPLTELVDVTSGPAGLVAVGFQNEGPAAWLSPDGLNWERVDLALDVRLSGVAHFDDGYFAWGTTGFRGSPTNDGMILTSADGRNWQPVSGDFSGAGGSDGYQNVESVGYDADLGYYAVGSDHKEFTNVGAIAVWQSADGTTWDRVEHDDEVFGTLTEFGYGTASGVTFVDGDVLAVGLTGQAVPDGGGIRCCDLTAAAWIGRP